MLLLLGTTIATSFLDSLNPSAIAQQMILQSMVKTKRLIWFFILGIGLANLILGLAVYYGIVAWVSRLLSLAVTRYPIPLFSLALIAGAVCFMWGICWIRKTQCTQASQGDESTKEPVSLSPISLFIMGAAFCAVELTSALPYFGFLTLLTGYQLAFPAVLLFVLLYDFMYILPLILLYFGYNRLQGTKAIQKLESILGKVSAYIVPGATALVGAVLAYYGGMSLLG